MPIDLSRLNLIRSAPDSSLRDPQQLELLIARLGLNDQYPTFMPQHLQGQLGRGLRLSQYPNQLAGYLTHVVGAPITSYVEIGTQHGGTFAATVTYLEATGHVIDEALAVDPQYAPGIERFVRMSPAAKSIRAPSLELKERLTSRRWGLALIDGDHAYEACRQDFETMHQAGSDIIALHDIVDEPSPGVARLWAEIQERHRDDYTFKTFAQQYPEVTAVKKVTSLGFGVATRRRAADR